MSNDGTIDVVLSGTGVLPPPGVNLELPIVTGGSTLSETVASGSVSVTAGWVYVASVASEVSQAGYFGCWFGWDLEFGGGSVWWS